MRLGPIAAATVICRDLDRSLAAYGHLGMCLVELSRVDKSRALAMGSAKLNAARVARLGGHAANPWLHLIEVPDAVRSSPFDARGWLALEVIVLDVDELAAQLSEEHFRVLGAPANLDVSDAIRAMQVVGPDGEVLYLTQVKRPVPPFDLPQAKHKIDDLFVAVLGCCNRDTTLAFYEGLGVVGRWRFDTRLGSVNRVHRREEADRHPVACAQLSGQHLIELDALPWLPPCSGELRTGIRMLSFARSSANGLRLKAVDDPTARMLAGPEGEWIELL